MPVGPHPESFVGVHPWVTETGSHEVQLPYLEAWDSDLILRHARGTRLVPDTGFHIPSGILHVPGTALTLELQALDVGGDGVLLSFWNEWAAEPYRAVGEDLVARFYEEHPGVEVTMRPIENESLFTTLRNAFASEEPPDVFQHEANNNLFHFVVEDRRPSRWWRSRSPAPDVAAGGRGRSRWSRWVGRRPRQAGGMAPAAADPATITLRPRLTAGMLVASAAALALAPLGLPDTYSWVSHTTSESAAQAVPGSWVARTGFVMFGLAVLRAAWLGAGGWTMAARWTNGGFGISMIMVAVFSARSWEPGASFEATEDTLHSVAATVVGVGFAFAVTATALGRRRLVPATGLDVLAVVASAALPLAMTAYPDVDGALQRIMFAVAYAWYLLAVLTPGPPGTPGRPAGTLVRAGAGADTGRSDNRL